MSCQTLEEKAKSGVTLGNYELKFEHVEFGNDFEEKAKNELRETTDVTEAAIKEFKLLITGEQGLRYPVEDEKKLKIFLRPCKFYPDSAFKLMQRYYKFQLKHPKYYDDLLPSREKAPFAQSLLTILPKRNSSGERILIIEAGRKWKPKTCSIDELIRAVILLIEAAKEEPRTQVAGAQVIIDVEGLSLQHVWHFTPTLAKDIVDFVQECLPLRVKGIHIVNQPYIFNMLYAIFKPFIGEKLRRRIHFHGTDFDSLQEYIDKKILPIKYDGSTDIPMDVGNDLQKYIEKFESEFKMRNEEGYLAEVK